MNKNRIPGLGVASEAGLSSSARVVVRRLSRETGVMEEGLASPLEEGMQFDSARALQPADMFRKS